MTSSKQEIMSQISRIGNYQPQTANDLLKLVYNNDKDGSIYQSLKKQFQFGDSETISSIVKKIANGIEDTYKDRGMGRVFNDTFSNPSSSSSSVDDNASFRLSSLKDDGNMDARPVGYGDRFTISNRPLTNASPLAGPYFCPETPDRVMVDGIIVVNRADEVRDFFNGQVMVMHIRGGDPADYNTPGTLRCGIVDKYRKAVQEYEGLYQKSASRGSNFIPWTFYLDNVGYSEEEEVAEIDKITPGGNISVSFSRFDGRDNFGYVKFLNFETPTPGTILDVIKVDEIVNFFKRAKGEKYEVYSDKILGDNDTIRFLEDDTKPGMTQSARERVQKFLKSDQTIVITINKKFLQERGFDDKMVTLFNIVKRLRRTNSAFYDRIAYYFYDNDNVIAKYKYDDEELDWANNTTPAPTRGLDDDAAFQKITGLDTGDVLGTGDLNNLYNCNEKSYQVNGFSSTSLFQIIRGSKSTTVLEMYIAKDAPDYYTSYSYAEENDFTQKLCRDNIVNLMCVPYVTETLLSQFAQRSELFPMLTSESRARRFYVRPLSENPFVENATATAAARCFIFKHDQLSPSIIEDLKNGIAVILHPECDGTEGSCIPPQLHAIASRYNATVHEAHKSLFDFAHGAKVVVMRAERRFATNNFELFMISGLKWTTYDIYGNCILDRAAVPGTNYDPTSCKFTSSELNIPKILDFLNKQKLSGRSFKTPSRAVGGARPVGNLVTLWSSI